jgi:hypothetical protein
MAETHVPAAAPVAAAQVEERDVNARAVVIFAIALTVVIVAVSLICLGLFAFFKARDKVALKSTYPLAEEQRNQELLDRLPPSPQLEGLTAPEDLRRDLPPVMGGGPGWPAQGPLQAAADEKALARPWVDKKAGLVRLPIDQAMQRLAKKLRAEGKGESNFDLFYRRPSAANSGRGPEGGRQ